jgi:hypothetical protein
MIRLVDNPHLVSLMSPEDQRTYGPGIHPPDEIHPSAKTGALERQEQRQFASYCLLKDYPFVWHATHRPSKATPGTPDFWVGCNLVGLWIEFKKDYTCKLSPDQEEFARKLEAQGMRLYIVYSAQEAIELVRYFDRLI